MIGSALVAALVVAVVLTAMLWRRAREPKRRDPAVLWCSIQPPGHGAFPSRFFGTEARAREEASKRPERQFVALSRADIEALDPRWREHARAALERLQAASKS